MKKIAKPFYTSLPIAQAQMELTQRTINTDYWKLIKQTNIIWAKLKVEPRKVEADYLQFSQIIAGCVFMSVSTKGKLKLIVLINQHIQSNIT